MSRLRMRVTALAAAGAMLVGLSACAPEPSPKPEPTPTESAAPIFASDEEALAAAVAAYEAYSAASDAIVHDGGADPGRIEPFVSESYFQVLDEEFAAFKKLGVSTIGATKHEQAELVSRAEAADGAAVLIYLCQDPSEVRVLDSSGVDVTPADRPALIPSQASFVSKPGEPDVLIVDGIEKWRGRDFC